MGWQYVLPKNWTLDNSPDAKSAGYEGGMFRDGISLQSSGLV